MSVYVGKSGSKKEVTALYVGKSGSKKEVAEAYYGKSGVKQIYTAVEPGQQVFTTSGTFTVPKGVRKVDVFLVGGGAGGCTYYYNNKYIWGKGGGGGYTKTQKGISVTPGSNYSIVVGSGGSCTDFTNSAINGGASSALGYSANGGGNPNGGSGGGQGIAQSDEGGHWRGGMGGSDGSSGYQKLYTWGYKEEDKYKPFSSGQGTTTRAFGESSGTLYAGGGGGGGDIGGGGDSGDGADANGGGGKGTWGATTNTNCIGKAGIVIIRWGY